MDGDSKRMIYGAAFITVFLWALANVLTRMAVTYYTPEAISFLRYLIAATALLSYAVFSKMRPPAPKDIPWFLLGGAIGFAFFLIAFNMGAKTVSAAIISFILNSAPIITAGLAQVFLKERIGTKGWVSIGGAFLGVAIITISDGGFTLQPGILLICLSAILMSLYNIFQRKLLVRYKPLEVTTYCITAGAILLLAFAPKAIPQLIQAPPSQLAVIFILGLLPTAVAYVLWAYALSKTEKTSSIINFMFFIPVITIFLGYVMLDEVPTATDLLGGGLIIASVVLINMRQKK